MRFSPPDHLLEHFSDGCRLLVLTDSQAFMAMPTAAFGSTDVQFCAVDLERLWNQFIREFDGKDEFTLCEVLRISRVDKTILTLWQCREIVHPVEGSYDLDDAFAARLCGILRRRGVAIRILHQVGRFVRNGTGLEVSI